GDALPAEDKESTLTVDREKPITQEGIMTRGKGKLSLLAASLAVATALFWSQMLISPPVTQAAMDQGIDVVQITFNARKGLPSSDATYQRHIVLDRPNAY
ncbi:MAG TPA: hypothetical protein VKA90_07550, partial [Beijerinckiaceae bacterium]|nr:hypothetical protein [Beijerinckiaceae bacterium]